MIVAWWLLVRAREVKCDMMSCESGRLYLIACFTEAQYLNLIILLMRLAFTKSVNMSHYLRSWISVIAKKEDGLIRKFDNLAQARSNRSILSHN